MQFDTATSPMNFAGSLAATAIRGGIGVVARPVTVRPPHLFELYEEDQISYDDAMRYADSQNELRLKIKLEGKAAKDKDAMDGLGHLSMEESEEESGMMR